MSDKHDQFFHDLQTAGCLYELIVDTLGADNPRAETIEFFLASIIASVRVAAGDTLDSTFAGMRAAVDAIEATKQQVAHLKSHGVKPGHESYEQERARLRSTMLGALARASGNVLIKMDRG